VSRHSTDRLALLVGIPLLALGLVDLADTAGLVDGGPWLVIPAVLLAGAIGVVWSLLSIRSDPGRRPPDPG
jgi:hypothetical protein